MGNWSQIKELWFKTFRFGPLIILGNVILTYGQRFLSADKIKSITHHRNSAIQAQLKPLVSRVINEYKNEPLVKSEIDDAQTIWVCWLQGEEAMPEIPRLCIESIRKNSCGRNVTVLTLDNFQNFVEIDPIIIDKYNNGLIKNCHFADILRVGILAQKGGLWMDATMFCTAPIDSHFLSDNFYSIRTKEFGNFVSRCRWAVYCLRSVPGNRLFRMLEKLFVEYIKIENYFIDYFMFDQFISMIYDSDAEIRTMIDNIKENNPNIFVISKKLHEAFDTDNWNRFIASTSMFKLNWKEYTSAQLADMGCDSYYSYLKEIVG